MVVTCRHAVAFEGAANEDASPSTAAGAAVNGTELRILRDLARGSDARR